MGNTNRNKGNRAEVYFRNKFIDAGFVGCRTSREASKLFDDLGIDLVNLPFLVQVKAGYPNLNPLAELEKYIKRLMANRYLLPHDYTKPMILIHRLDIGRGNKRKPEHELVYMMWEDYNEICQKVNIVNNYTDSVENTLIVLHFDDFMKMIQCLNSPYLEIQ